MCLTYVPNGEASWGSPWQATFLPYATANVLCTAWNHVQYSLKEAPKPWCILWSSTECPRSSTQHTVASLVNADQRAAIWIRIEIPVAECHHPQQRGLQCTRLLAHFRDFQGALGDECYMCLDCHCSLQSVCVCLVVIEGRWIDNSAEKFTWTNQLSGHITKRLQSQHIKSILGAIYLIIMQCK